MMQYVFDDTELRAILRLAYKHGYVHGLFSEPPEPQKRKREVIYEDHLAFASLNYPFGNIIAGAEPPVPEEYWD